MKKLFFLSVMLTAAMAASAQMKIAPKMEKVMKRVYNAVSTTAIPGQKEVKITTDQQFTVTEATADGFVVDVETTTFSSDVTPDNIAGQLVSSAAELMKGINVRVATNKDGKPEKIVNYEELKPKMDRMGDQIIEKLSQLIPQITQMLPKDALKQQLMENMSEKQLLRSMQGASSVMALNGKSIASGAQDEYTNSQGIKMKRFYLVNGKKVTATSTMNMTQDDMKKMIIEKVEQLAPGQAQMVKDNIDTLVESGLLKAEGSEKAVYELADDGWVKTLNMESTMKVMQQETTTTVTITRQ
jgi:hypothetical protein